MITSATFENAKWYEEYLEKGTFIGYNAPEKELAFFQRTLFEEENYQILNSQGKINPSVNAKVVSHDNISDLKQVLIVKTIISGQISTMTYQISQVRSHSNDTVATTDITLLPPFDVHDAIKDSFNTNGPLAKIQ